MLACLAAGLVVAVKAVLSSVVFLSVCVRMRLTIHTRVCAQLTHHLAILCIVSFQMLR